MHHVIVGNGVAGMEAALTLRRRDPDARITVVSEESDHFFSRTALMYVASGQLAHKDIEPLERDVYTRMRFERVRARAVGLDPAGRRLRLAGLPDLAYDQLLLAVGSRARPAPWAGAAALPGVGHLVTLQDLHAFTRELHGDEGYDQPERPWAHLPHSAEGSPYARRPTARELRGSAPAAAAVVGGGLIGIESIEVMLAAGLKPTFIVREESFWPIALDAREGAWVADALRAHGVDVRLGAQVTAVRGDRWVTGLETTAGDVPCDVLVVAIGVVPQTEWLEGAVARAPGNGGVLVDDALRSSAPGVFAAGDCAAVRWPDGSARPEPLWYTGRAQGRVAAAAMLGDDVRYRRGTWYNSAKLMDIEYTTVGQVNQRLPGEQQRVIEERGKVQSLTRFVSVDGRIVGFNALGRRWDHSVIARWIEERRPLAHALAHLAEAAFDTEFVPPLVVPEER